MHHRNNMLKLLIASLSVASALKIEQAPVKPALQAKQLVNLRGGEVDPTQLAKYAEITVEV